MRREGSISSISRGLSNIAKEILEDAEKEAKDIILKAKSQAERILKEGEEEAERRYRRIIKEAEERIKSEEQMKISMFEIESRNRLLRVKESLIEEVFERALNRLREYTLTQEYQGFLLTLISEACERIDSDKLLIQLNKKDHQRLTEGRLNSLSEKMGVELVKSDDFIDCVGGVIVKSSDGKIVVNNTFENRLNMVKDALRAKIAKILSEEE